jgi:hypothetical protein
VRGERWRAGIEGGKSGGGSRRARERGRRAAAEKCRVGHENAELGLEVMGPPWHGAGIPF